MYISYPNPRKTKRVEKVKRHLKCWYQRRYARSTKCWVNVNAILTMEDWIDFKKQATCLKSRLSAVNCLGLKRL